MRSVVGLLGVISLAFISASPVSADVVTRWNANAGRAALAVCLAPEGNGLYEARMYATMHIAIHDALNAVSRRSEPYAFREKVHLPTSHRSAVAAAAHRVLAAHVGATPLVPPACIQSGLASVDADYAAALAEIPDGPAKVRGVELGRAAAEAILAVRLADGSDTVLLVDTGYPQGTQPGEYRFTPGTPFGAIIVGCYDGPKLKFVAKVRAGFVPHVRREVYQRLRGFKTREVPVFESAGEAPHVVAITAGEIKECRR